LIFFISVITSGSKVWAKSISSCDVVTGYGQTKGISTCWIDLMCHLSGQKCIIFSNEISQNRSYFTSSISRIFKLLIVTVQRKTTLGARHYYVFCTLQNGISIACDVAYCYMFMLTYWFLNRVSRFQIVHNLSRQTLFWREQKWNVNSQTLLLTTRTKCL